MIYNQSIQNWLEIIRFFGYQIVNQLEIVRPNRKNPINRRYAGRTENLMPYKP